MMGGSYESFEEKLEAAENGDEDAAGYSELFKSAEQNLQKAAEAYKKAADQGHAPSQWNLACFYLNGTDGVAQHNGPFGVCNETEGLMLAYKSL